MSKGFTSPEQSVLLDYLSPWNVVALGKACKAKHYAVAIAISGTLLTQLLVLISTGLFVSQDEVFPRSSNSPTKVFSLPENFNPFQVDIRPRINLNGFNGSTQYPVGSTEQLAFQPFYLPLNTSLARPQYSATVNVFSSDINCQASTRSSFKNGDGSASVIGCDITWFSQGQRVMNDQHILMQNGTCTAPGVVSDGDSENKQRLVICAMDANVKEHTDGKLHGNFGSAGAGPLATIMADPITCLTCVPQYSIKAGNVTMTGRTFGLGLAGAKDQIKDSFAIDTHHNRVAPKPPSKTRAMFQMLDGRIKIIQPKNLKKDDILAQMSGASFESWIPLVMKPFFQILLCLLPVALITTLAVLLIRFDRSKGIVDLPLDNPNVHYAWTLQPAAILFGITVIYGMLDTAIQTLQPFQNLSNGRTAHESTTHTKNFGGMIPIRAFLYAFRHGHLAMMATTLTTLPGPATTTFDGVNMKITGWFNVTEQPPPEHLYWSALNNSDPFMTTRIMYSNASYPRWTYSELALAKIDLADDTAEDILSSEGMSVSSDPPSITVEVPALRVVMNCTTRPYATTRRQPLYSIQSDYSLLEVNLSLPDICDQLDESTSFTCTDNKMSTQWMYKPGIIGYWAESWTQARTTMGVLGDIDEEGIPKNLTILTCTPYLETVQTRAIFDLPSFELADHSVAVDTSGTPRIETI
ncbi:MAG: hypothetical protein Q9192_006492 [Flavoplaca navasiana]